MLEAVIDFHTDLSVEECRERLQTATINRPILAKMLRPLIHLHTRQPVSGWMWGNDFGLYRWNTSNARNIYVRLHGELVATSEGTRVVGWVGVRLMRIVYTVVIFISAINALLLQLGYITVSMLVGIHELILGNSWQFDAVTDAASIVGGTLLSLLVFVLMIFQWRKDIYYLEHYLAELLEGDTAPAPPTLPVRLPAWNYRPGQLYFAIAATSGGAILLLSAIAAYRLPLLLRAPLLWLGDFTAPLFAGWLLAAIHARRAPLSPVAAIARGLLLGGLCVGITLALTLEPLSAWPPLYLLAMGAMGGVGGYFGGRQFAG